MIICDDYKLVFVQIPHTGSTGIGRRLVEDHGGREVLCKHSYLDELKARYPREYRDYFIVGGVRNPMDDKVSSFFKMKSDHLGLYSGNLKDEKAIASGRRGRKLRRTIVENDMSFSESFVKSVRFVYWNPISILQDRYDLVSRFENIQTGMQRVMQEVGAPALTLRKNNPTAGRDRDYSTYYDHAAQVHARRIFSPFVHEWDYDFPNGWAEGVRPGRAATLLGWGLRRVQWKLRSIQNRKRYSDAELGR